MAAHLPRGGCRHVQVRRQERDALREAGQESRGGEGASQQASHTLRKGKTEEKKFSLLSVC